MHAGQAFAVGIWLFVNLFRVLFINGLIRISWEFLNSGYFTYIATCTVDGEHTYEADDLADRVHGMLSGVRWTGIALVGIACASQVPWIWALDHFSRGFNGAGSILSVLDEWSRAS